jgi:hypothetical protein
MPVVAAGSQAAKSRSLATAARNARVCSGDQTRSFGRATGQVGNNGICGGVYADPRLTSPTIVSGRGPAPGSGSVTLAARLAVDIGDTVGVSLSYLAATRQYC